MDKLARSPAIPDFTPLLQSAEKEPEPVSVDSLHNERRVPPSIYIRKPKDLKWCQMASPVQFFNLFLIVYYYIYLLKVEDYTFGWKGALKAYGVTIEVHSNDRCQHTVQKPLHIKHPNGKVQTETRWNHNPICEVYHFQPNFQLLLNSFIIASATFMNLLCYHGKAIKNSVQGVISVVVLVVYILGAGYVIYVVGNGYIKDEIDLPVQMELELNGQNCVYPDDISSLWSTTQAKSQCCGGATGPQDWTLCNGDGRYHFSCLNTKKYKYQELTPLNYPKEDEIWKEGCIRKELKKMHHYTRFIIASLVIQAACCAVIIGSFAYAPLGSILPIAATFGMITGKPRRKVTVIMRGDRKRFEFSQLANKFVIRVKDVTSRNEIEEDVEIPEYYWRRLFRSRYCLSVCESQMLTLQVEVSGHSSFIQTIRTERCIDSRYEYLKVFNDIA